MNPVLGVPMEIIDGGGELFLLRDEFSDTRAAGSVNLSLATDKRNPRTVVDSYATTELIVNGGFETAGAGGADVFGTWTETAGDGALADGTGAGEFHAGAHAVKLTAGATSNTLIYQAITVIPARQYTVTFWARGDATVSGRYRIYDVTNAAPIINYTSAGVTSATYAQVSVTFTTPAGCVSVQIQLVCPAANGGVAYFDDVSVLPTAGLLSISGGAAVFAGGKASAVHGDPGLVYSGKSRVAGRFMLINLAVPSLVGEADAGFHTSSTPSNVNYDAGMRIISSGAIRVVVASGSIGDYLVLATNTPYRILIALRATGSMFFIKGGAYTQWTLFTVQTSGNAATVYPEAHALSNPISLDFIRIPRALWLPSPLASDSFTRADGAVGSTDGAGHAEGQPNLITNGNFETLGAGGADVFGSWTEAAGDGTIANGSGAGEFHDGAYALKLTCVSTDCQELQTFAVTAGKTYTLSFWTRGDGVKSGGRFGVYNATASAWIVLPVPGVLNATTSYQQFTNTFTTPAGCVSVAVYFYCPSPHGGIAYFDDVTLRETNPVLGAGGAGLAWTGGAISGNKLVITPTVGATENSGTLAVGTWYSIVTTEADHFYVGCAIGETFRALATTALDASNTVKPITLATAMCSVALSTANVLADIAMTRSNAKLQASVMMNLDSAASPANFVLVYTDAATIKVAKCVGGTWSAVSSTAYTYSAGAVIRVIKDGTAYSVYYNNALLTTQAVTDAGIVDNKLHGVFSTDATNTFTNYVCYARGTEGQWSALDRWSR